MTDRPPVLYCRLYRSQSYIIYPFRSAFHHLRIESSFIEKKSCLSIEAFCIDNANISRDAPKCLNADLLPMPNPPTLFQRNAGCNRKICKKFLHWPFWKQERLTFCRIEYTVMHNMGRNGAAARDAHGQMQAGFFICVPGNLFGKSFWESF